MTTGTLTNGFNFAIEDSAVDNWELLEVLVEIDSGKQILITKAFPMLLGAEQFNSLKEHLRKEGRISTTEMMSVFTEIMTIVNAKK